MTNIIWTPIESAFDNTVKFCIEEPWIDFASRLLLPHTIVDKKEDALLIIPCKFKLEGDYERSDKPKNDDFWPRRCAANLESTTMLFVDFDGGDTIEDAMKEFCEYEYVGYTTYSHRSKGKDYKDAFRLVFPLKEHINTEDFVARRLSMLVFFGKADKTTFAQSRGFYSPSCSLDMKDQSKSWHNHGELLSILDMPAVEQPKFIIKEYKQDLSTKGQLLNKFLLQALCARGRAGWEYHTWLKVGTTMKRVGFTLQDFIAVTMSDPQHQQRRGRNSITSITGAWKTFNPNSISYGFPYLEKVSKGEAQ